MPPRNPKNTSFGVFASSSASSFLTSEDLKKHYFSTTYSRELVEKRLTEEDKLENFMHVHNVGKTFGKYMPFRRCPAPLLDRSSCLYNRDFDKKPAITLQCEANRDLAQGNKPIRKKLSKAVISIPVQSQYSIDYPERAKQPPVQPSFPEKGGRLHVMLGGRGPNLVKTSHNQTVHGIGCHSRPFNPNGEIDPSLNVYKSNVPTQDYHMGDFSKTSYHHEFSGKNQRRKQAVGSLMKTMDRCESAPADMRALMNLGH